VMWPCSQLMDTSSLRSKVSTPSTFRFVNI
jgi:hypothetical protein